MDFYISLKVNFRGNSKNFLLSGSETKNWESMEAMVKRSFGLCSLQLTYLDEENEEVSINSQVEYEEALKSAARQGNRLHMNVYEMRGQPARVSNTKASGAEPKRGFRPPQHCPALAQVVSRKIQAAVPEQGMVILKEVRGTKEEDKTPPAWFTSYMEKFKDQVVREAVEKICREFSGQCCIHKPLGGGHAGGGAGVEANRGEAIAGAEAQQIPEVSSSTLPGAPSSSTPPCSSCQGQTTGGGYQCSVCTSCTLCEPCSFTHDPSHNLVRARTPLSIPEHGSPAPDHSRFYRRGDRSFRKAEKQRLKAEKRLLKAEVKEIRKQLRMERRGLQWTSLHHDESSSPILLQPRAAQQNSPERPKCPCPLVVPTMTAAFLDENLPDGTRLRPGTKFIKYWKMRNTGKVSWSADTKLKFMWGNFAVVSGDRWREVSVPFLQPGQVGIVSVAMCAPVLEGSYTSHWRLAHSGEQFGPRVWCSIIVDPLAPAPVMADGILMSPCVTPQGKNPVMKDGKVFAASPEQRPLSVDQEEYFIPSVDLLTAQDLLSFELLDINIVQELESVPNNTPADMTPCMSPVPQHGFTLDKVGPCLDLIQEETDVTNSSTVPHLSAEGGCSVKNKSMKVKESPGGSHCIPQNPLKTRKPSLQAPLSVTLTRGGCPMSVQTTLQAPATVFPMQDVTATSGSDRHHMESVCAESKERETEKKPEEEKKEGEENRGSRTRSSSTSSEDYIIILPDCFDTSRPLGESMYSFVLSQPGEHSVKTPTDTESSTPEHRGSNIMDGEDGELNECASTPKSNMLESSSANDMLCTSQTLDDEPLTPEVVTPPKAIITPGNGETGDATWGETEHSEPNQTKDASATEETPTCAAEGTEDNPEDSRWRIVIQVGTDG